MSSLIWAGGFLPARGFLIFLKKFQEGNSLFITFLKYFRFYGGGVFGRRFFVLERGRVPSAITFDAIDVFDTKATIGNTNPIII